LLEGLLRATTDKGLSQWLATGETLISIALFVSAILFIRSTRTQPEKEKAAQAN
jgi:uncharacterized membrane protein